MKHKPLLTSTLLAALAVPALANDAQPADQTPPVAPLELTHVEEDGASFLIIPDKQVLEGVDVAKVDAEIVFEGGEPNLVLRINGEEIQLNGEADPIELELPEMIREVAPAPKPIEATFLGVVTEPMTTKAAQAAGLKQPTGLQVSFIQKDSPAAQAGLKTGDVLLKLNDQILINNEQLVVLIRSFGAGEKVTLHGLREGKPVEIEATLSKTMVAPVGPGGAALNQPGWRVQQKKPVGLRVFPGNLHDEFPPLELDVDADLEAVMRKARLAHEQSVQELRQQLELDLEAMQGGVKPGFPMPSKVIKKSDGQHSITLKTAAEGRHLTIQDKAGNVLYEGLLPAENVEQHLVEGSGLPADVFKKVQPMLDGNMLKLDLKIDGKPAPEKAPEEEAEPSRA